MKLNLVSQEWYNALIEDCKAIITETEFTARWALIEGYHALGKRICEENDNFTRVNIYGAEIVQRVGKSLGKSRQTIYYAIQFAKEYPELETAPFEKNVSWREICLKLLPAPKDGLNGFEPKVYDVWNFTGLDERYGIRHPGNIPAGIVQNVLYYWTKEGDAVIDPMAGGGVTIDVCKAMNRICFAYDIMPMRDDVTKLDIGSGYPQEAYDCDLIFIDPPYWKKKANDYSPESISALSREDYLSFFNIFALNSYRALKSGGYLAFLMSNYVDFDNHKNSIWVDDYIRCFESAGFERVREIQCPLSTEQYKAHDVVRAKNEKGLLSITRSLWILKK